MSGLNLNVKPKGRFAEPSTYAGIGLIVTGLSRIFDINEAPMIADMVTSQAQNLASGDWLTAIIAIITGAAAWWKREGK